MIGQGRRPGRPPGSPPSGPAVARPTATGLAAIASSEGAGSDLASRLAADGPAAGRSAAGSDEALARLSVPLPDSPWQPPQGHPPMPAHYAERARALLDRQIAIAAHIAREITMGRQQAAYAHHIEGAQGGPRHPRLHRRGHLTQSAAWRPTHVSAATRSSSLAKIHRHSVDGSSPIMQPPDARARALTGVTGIPGLARLPRRTGRLASATATPPCPRRGRAPLPRLCPACRPAAGRRRRPRRCGEPGT